MIRTSIFALVALGGVGCTSHEHIGPFQRAGDMDQASVVAPAVDRCEAFKTAKATYTSCQSSKTEVTEYLRRLSTGDTVCMQEGFGEEITSKCKARGVVIDGDARGFLIEFRDPSTDSTWKDYQGKRVYFENGALTDIYLRERGYE